MGAISDSPHQFGLGSGKKKAVNFVVLDFKDNNNKKEKMKLRG